MQLSKMLKVSKRVSYHILVRTELNFTVRVQCFNSMIKLNQFKFGLKMVLILILLNKFHYVIYFKKNKYIYWLKNIRK